ncbi:hypothetical protein [Agaribacterium sp. ZY112]|uniref:hypothetical protein n=1 Tax=Agaribacterium sp. ZY112 TaxID=3233574 RepID=UPI00352311A7
MKKIFLLCISSVFSFALVAQESDTNTDAATESEREQLLLVAPTEVLAVAQALAKQADIEILQAGLSDFMRLDEASFFLSDTQILDQDIAQYTALNGFAPTMLLVAAQAPTDQSSEQTQEENQDGNKKNKEQTAIRLYSERPEGTRFFWLYAAIADKQNNEDNVLTSAQTLISEDAAAAIENAGFYFPPKPANLRNEVRLGLKEPEHEGGYR